jgi:hypothetical protein
MESHNSDATNAARYERNARDHFLMQLRLNISYACIAVFSCYLIPESSIAEDDLLRLLLGVLPYCLGFALFVVGFSWWMWMMAKLKLKNVSTSTRT